MRWSVEESNGNEEWKEGEWKRKRKKRNLLEGWLSCTGYDFTGEEVVAFLTSWEERLKGGGGRGRTSAVAILFILNPPFFFLGLSWWRYNDQSPPIEVGWHCESVKNGLAVLQRP